MIIAIACALAVLVMAFLLFVRPQDLHQAEPVSPFAHLDERKASIYENLRDLQFEYRLGKMSDDDYQSSKQDLQKELARVMAEVEKLAGGQKVQAKPAAAYSKKASAFVCPSCKAEFPAALKFCGECGKPMKASQVVSTAILLLLLFVPHAAKAAAIDGIVLNGATGKPQAGATVTLFRLASANGPEALESVKSGVDGKFSMTKEVPGPRMIQAAFDGVTYSTVITPATPPGAITVNVFPASAKPGSAKIDQHMMLLEPTPSNQLNVSESFVWQNDGKSTYNDPDHGTLLVYLPPGTGGKAEVNALAPGGMPIRRALEKTAKPDVYKIDFPIKPGQSRIDLAYTLPFTSPGEFESKVLYKGGPTRLVTAQTVTLAGPGVTNLGPGPQGTNATIWGIDGSDLKVAVTGTGSLKGDSGPDNGGGSDQGQQISQIMPKLYQLGSPNAGFWPILGSVKWIITLIMGILALGFVLLYRAGTGESVKATSGSNRR